MSSFIDDKTECIEYGDKFVWLASLQAGEKSSGAILDAMELLARQARGHDLEPAADSVGTGGHLVFRRW